jgi:uncharacterized cupin superfamily protein
MNRTEHNPEALLDAAIQQVVADPVDAQAVEQARSRVWERLNAEASAAEPVVRVDHIRNCADFQALMPDFRAGKLSLARRMLIEDHIHECVACRRAMHPEAQMKPMSKVVELPHRTWNPKRWAIAAMLLVGVGSSVWVGYDRFGPAPQGSRATLVAADGGVYRLAGGNMLAVQAGSTLQDGDRLRTANGAHAVVRLLDGSTVEVAERGEFSVSADRRNMNLTLGRGRIIVQAAKRTNGHLYINTSDARVAVTGTVFSVNRGMAGTRVSVVEGEVIVDSRGNEHVLHAGDQQATHPSIARVSVADEIAWSRNFDQHLALLKQFVDMKEKLDAVQMPGLRYSSRFLDAVPEGTNIYISVPNLSRAAADVQRIVSDQARQSPEMQQWLQNGMPRFEEFTQKLTTLGNHLGDEVIFAFQDCAGFCGIAIADVHRPGLKEFIEKEAAAVQAPFRVVEGTSLPATRKGELLVAFAGNRVFIGEQQQLLAAAMKGGSAFAQTPFGQAISDTYRRGTGVMVAVNLEHMISKELAGTDTKHRTVFTSAGIDKVKYLIAQQRTVNDKSEYVASVSFNSARQGIASWLAEPSTMGSLGFVSPNAQFASSVVMKNPAQLLDEAIALAGGKATAFDQIQQTTGVDVRQEVASALGGEMTFAFDGPMLPTPSWKIIAEVNDPVKLQGAIEKLVQAGNRELEKHGKPKLEVQAIENRTRQGVAHPQAATEHVIKTGMPLVPEIHYAFVDGYIVIAPTEQVLAKSLSDRMSGISLARSRQFTRLLPRDQRTSFSAMVYQNAGELLSLVAKGGGAVAGANPDQQRQVEQLAGKVEPMLVCVYGATDRIEIASQGSAWNMLMNSFAGNLLGMNSRGTRAPRASYR